MWQIDQLLVMNYFAVLIPITTPTNHVINLSGSPKDFRRRVKRARDHAQSSVIVRQIFSTVYDRVDINGA